MTWMILTITFFITSIALMLMWGREIREHNACVQVALDLAKELTCLKMDNHNLRHPKKKEN